MVMNMLLIAAYYLYSSFFFYNLNLLSSFLQRLISHAFPTNNCFGNGTGMKEGTTVIVNLSVSKSTVLPFTRYLSNFPRC